MLTVLIVDDEEDVRRQALRALAGLDVKLASASNGRVGLEQASLLSPDIVVCDVDMPEVNGFDVLAALKANQKLASVQVIMLTALSSRHGVRLGMSLGADDYLTKPFTDAELAEAVAGLIRRRSRIDGIKGTNTHEDWLRKRFANEIAGELAWTDADAPKAGSEHVLTQAAVLFAGIRSFTSIAEKLSSAEVADLLAEYFEHASRPVLTRGGQYLKLLGDGLMAVFIDDTESTLNASQRALLAATEMLRVSADIAAWVSLKFPDTRLPPFQVGFGVDCGKVSVTQIGAGLHTVEAPIGEAINVAARLEHAGKSLGWSIVASTAAIEHAGDVAVTFRVRTLALSKGAPAQVHELLGMELSTRAADGPDLARTCPHDPAAPANLSPEVTSTLRNEARAHAQAAARAVKDALGERLSALRRGELREEGGAGRLQGFHVLRPLGGGGMSKIYLARQEDNAELVVLKVLAMDSSNAEQQARFMLEYSLLSRIEHPHVVRIFNQGFSEHSAYITMEYFENGDLRSRMGAPFTPKAAIAVLEQVASALAAVHGAGIIHRDLKPENLMVRANGDVALADFGIAKQIGSAQPTLTVAGEVVGSPSYMSPEQFAGAKLTHHTDLYSLGVLLYELTAGRRPYVADTLMELVGLHMKAPTPKLPADLAALQPVLETLMAKDPAARYPTAEAARRALWLAARSF